MGEVSRDVAKSVNFLENPVIERTRVVKSLDYVSCNAFTLLFARQADRQRAARVALIGGKFILLSSSPKRGSERMDS